MKPTKCKDPPPATHRPKFVWRKRDMQGSRLYNLKLDIHALNHEIGQLMAHKATMDPPYLNRHVDDHNTTGVKIVVEYFRIFATGLLTSAYDAVSYVRHSMAEDLRVNSFFGRDMLLHQWRVRSVVFPQYQLELIQSSVQVLRLTATKVFVRCRARFQFQISTQTVGTLFPHILHRHDLLDKLVGKRVGNFVPVNFIVNLETLQIERIDVVPDYFNCIAKLITNVEELVEVFGQAKIKDEYYLGEIQDHGHAQV